MIGWLGSNEARLSRLPRLISPNQDPPRSSPHWLGTSLFRDPRSTPICRRPCSSYAAHRRHRSRPSHNSLGSSSRHITPYVAITLSFVHIPLSRFLTTHISPCGPGTLIHAFYSCDLSFFPMTHTFILTLIVSLIHSFLTTHYAYSRVGHAPIHLYICLFG